MLKVTLDRLCAHPNLDVALYSFVVNASCIEGRIRNVTIADHSGLREVQAAAFVDATGEPDLARRAGLPTNLRLAGSDSLQTASFPVRIGGVETATEMTQELLRDVAAECSKIEPDLPIREDGGVCWRLPNSDLWWMGVDFAVEGTESGSLSDAETNGRRAAYAWMQVLRRKKCFRVAFIAATGPQLGVLETPHVSAEAHVTASEARVGQTSYQGIARAGWPMEVHAVAGKPRYERIGGERSVQRHEATSFPCGDDRLAG